MSYAYYEPPPPIEGIWPCRRCMMDRPFGTTPALEGRDVPDAPLFCDDCGWEYELEVDELVRFPEPPVRIVRPMPPQLRAEGRARWQRHLLSQLAPRTPKAAPPPPITDEAAIQLARILAERGRRT